MSQLPSLDAIGIKYGTDKSSAHHNYLNFYELFFAPLREKQLQVLEIGVLHGASLRTWEEYFQHSKIVGVDLKPAAKFHEMGRIRIVLADQSNVEELTSVAVEHGPFDIVIDDGSHMWNHQITSLRTLFPFMRNGGIYIVEDLHTNYGPLQKDYKGSATSTCVDFLKVWLDLRVGDDQMPLDEIEDPFLRTYGRGIDFIAFYRRASLIKKRLSPPVRNPSAGQALVAVSAAERSVPVAVLAHVAALGDVFSPAGFVNPGHDERQVQGFSLRADPCSFEYRVRFPDGSWSAWTKAGDFAGTRGQWMPLTGFTIRLLGRSANHFELRAAGRFAGSERRIEVSDGQDCVSQSGESLCGIQVEIAKRSG